MVNDCNDYAKVGKVTEGFPSAQHPLHDFEAARNVFKASQSCPASDAAMLQSYGFPAGPNPEKLKEFWTGKKEFVPFEHDGKDAARQEVTKGMPADQQKRVHDQEVEYQKAMKANHDNALWGTSITRADRPNINDEKYKDLKAREDAVNKKLEHH
jgi:hypothetical protein